MKRAALYVRVSTQEQKAHGLSVDSQIVALREYCQENGYTEAGLFNDAGISARKRYTKRPALLSLVAACQRGEVDVILFTKLDRWFRSVADYYEVQAVLDSCGVPWRAIWEDYETETSAGVFKVNIMLSVAQSEADRTSERIKAVNEFKRARGDYVGHAPTGYMLQGPALVKNPETEAGVAAFFDTYLNTFSMHAAVLAAHARGLMLSKDVANHVLKNPVYCGQASGGYACEPYITREQFDSIQNSRVTYSITTPRKKNTYLFTGGLFVCGCCGRAMIGSFRNAKSGQEVRSYKFYKCAGARNMVCENRATISELVVEKFLLQNLEAGMAEYNASLATVEKDQLSNEMLREKLEAKLARVGDRYEEGDISKEIYIQKRDALKKEIAALEYIRPVSKKSLPENWRQIYEDLDADHRRAFWYSTINRVEYLKGKPLKILF